ncbi:hypothetical protein DAPPUDRAFT_268916 [Daphnia pulex]|uniref:Secreted protein n=1 Tax=Daphnia pulex TaxID=6669 RepID=E9HYJ3_DAPPU|nr:hypothetical protein DAPPUDRAFT_268916 [Daphnia pulex]|eukprot:EFX63187.1 hypothetical protein DAPPUDRAFT_268916 [Daphnia pulex]
MCETSAILLVLVQYIGLWSSLCKVIPSKRMDLYTSIHISRHSGGHSLLVRYWTTARTVPHAFAGRRNFCWCKKLRVSVAEPELVA